MTGNESTHHGDGKKSKELFEHKGKTVNTRASQKVK
jgi:hypothetical protein